MGYNSSQNINLHIYDTDINVTVPREKEEQWRKAAQLINEKLNAYFGAYKDQKSVKEILYYAMIDIALNYIFRIYIYINGYIIVRLVCSCIF